MVFFNSIYRSPFLVFFIFTYAHANDGGDSNFDFGGGGKPCPNFRCGKTMSPVPKPRSKFVSSGCGAMGGGVMMMGQGMGKEVYAECCDLWHACYQTCGASKKNCDDGFSTCSKKMCAGNKECTSSADINSMMLNMGGCQKFDQAQYQACQCVTKDKVEKSRADSIRYFYKKYAPENVGKAEQLATKADTSSKMAGLFKKLLTKYPDAITKTKDPQQQMYEEMMNNVGKKGEEKEKEEEEEPLDADEDLDDIQEL
mmetsp:Transcript_4/g.13  ORF Transcript_4/g.13 Transcript_4/m.13 type:complete len:255 (+) Transcript_4:59-823(+)|eukprot:CAMPEP_0195519860 /NCGR_PEP_ID=MMETSP0794_2-20130614/15645_1 /TAXON_ID=515487 /ORGANISM="Stephanopyxis turris, Strain CCMP 815" /LENGTH=254 /DNA_ID=CAMNT_0040649091 /DNA_START=53 /DNA_END=817 /DNA_ORIENTATION=-